MLQDIIKNKCNESNIQKYLELNNEILIYATYQYSRYYRCFPKFKLGSDFECDFLIFRHQSGIMETVIVELKLPNAKLLTKSKIPTKDLNFAISQVNRYMNWINDNREYFLKQMFNKPQIRECYLDNSRNYVRSVIVIGKRSQYNDYENQYKKDIYNTTNRSIEIMPYERLIECENELHKINQYKFTQ